MLHVQRNTATRRHLALETSHQTPTMSWQRTFVVANWPEVWDGVWLAESANLVSRMSQNRLTFRRWHPITQMVLLWIVFLWF